MCRLDNSRLGGLSLHLTPVLPLFFCSPQSFPTPNLLRRITNFAGLTSGMNDHTPCTRKALRTSCFGHVGNCLKPIFLRLQLLIDVALPATSRIHVAMFHRSLLLSFVFSYQICLFLPYPPTLSSQHTPSALGIFYFLLQSNTRGNRAATRHVNLCSERVAYPKVPPILQHPTGLHRDFLTF